MPMTDASLAELKAYVTDKLVASKHAAQQLAVAETDVKNAALGAMADALWQSRHDILAANQADIDAARAAGQPEARLDRLRLDEQRIQQLMEGLRQVAALPDPIGETLDTFTRPNGLQVERIRVPMGVVAMIYESRPNVTVDAAALCLKTGNAAVLRGGREALLTNQSLVDAMRRALRDVGIPADAIQFIDRAEHETVDVLLRARGLVDLAIPRGGAGLISRVVEQAQVPVIETGVGNCHIYVDAAANLDMATDIVMNAKTQRPSVCNAVETVLVHERAADAWLPVVVAALQQRGVEVRGCDRTRALLNAAGVGALEGVEAVVPATEADWETEFLDLIVAVKVVDDCDAAIDHIARYGSRHSEVIVTDDAAAAESFLAQVDAAVVYHNASSRFTDGFEFGFGAEIGISTQKLHARGPMGLPELTSYKYLVRGEGQVRP